MKEEINLMPPTATRERTKRLYIVHAKGIYNALVIGVLLVAASYAVAYGVLYWTNRNLEQELASNQQDATSVKEETRAINTISTFVRGRIVSNRPFAPNIISALAVAPSGINVTGIDAQREDQVITLSGQADARSALVAFENALRELSWVEDVDAPLQNFASGPNVTFRFTITRKP